MATCALSLSQSAGQAPRFRNHPRVSRAVVASSTTAGELRNTQVHTLSRRKVLSILMVPGLLAANATYAEAKNITDAKREREERKRAVREAAAQAREDGLSIDAGLSSDYSLPEGAQRGRNSRTVPQKRTE